MVSGQTTDMFPTYADQVMDATDADGLLTSTLVQVLMDDHSTSIEALRADGYTGNRKDAAALLQFMGY